MDRKTHESIFPQDRCILMRSSMNVAETLNYVDSILVLRNSGKIIREFQTIFIYL